MSRRADLTGVVLAGGRSRRMGQDKALLRIDDQPLVVHVARRLEIACDRVLVAVGQRRLDGVGYEQVLDRQADVGPLAGIVAALSACATPLAAVVAVDMPFVAPDVLSLLADRWAGEVAVVPEVAGRIHPLHGVYSRSSAAALARAVATGEHRVVDVLVRLGACVVDESVWGRLDAGATFVTNVNRPEDLDRLVQR